MKEKTKKRSPIPKISPHTKGNHYYSSEEEIEQPTIAFQSTHCEERASPEPGQQLVVEANGRFDKGTAIADAKELS